jgi:hypothetical protein
VQRFDEPDHSRGCIIRGATEGGEPGIHTLDRWLWIAGSPRSLSSRRPEAGPGGGAPE